MFMRRNSFIKFCLAIGGLTISPFKVEARSNSNERVKKWIMVANGKDRFEKSAVRHVPQGMSNK